MSQFLRELDEVQQNIDLCKGICQAENFMYRKCCREVETWQFGKLT